MNFFRLFSESAQLHKDALAIVEDGRETTYCQLMTEVSRAAGWLRREGLGSGDRIIVFAANRAEHIVFYLACARLGIVFSPVHPSFRAREVSYVLNSCRPGIALVDESTIETLIVAVSQSGVSPKTVSFGRLDGHPDVQCYFDLEIPDEDVGVADLPPEAPLSIIYTSGTTSHPKPVLRSHGADTWSVENYVKGWSFEAGDRVLVTLTLAWSWGLAVMSMSTLAAGGTIYLDRGFNPVRALTWIAEHQITTFAGSMSMYGMLLDVLTGQKFQISSLNKMFLGGEPRNDAMVAAAEALFGQRLCEGYALTECFPLLVVNPRDDLHAPVGSVGRAVSSDAQIKLVSPDGSPVQRGEVGHALIKSPGRMTEYLGEPEMTAERLTPDGWVKTGDLLREVNGHYIFAGRSTDMIIRGGANISPLEIEAALIEHPKVKDATVVGVTDATKGERIVALTVLHENEIETEAALLAFLESALARYKVPQHIVFLEEIPVGATGKKNRRALQDIALQKLGAQQEPL